MDHHYRVFWHDDLVSSHRNNRGYRAREAVYVGGHVRGVAAELIIDAYAFHYRAAKRVDIKIDLLHIFVLFELLSEMLRRSI